MRNLAVAKGGAGCSRSSYLFSVRFGHAARQRSVLRLSESNPRVGPIVSEIVAILKTIC